MKCLRCGRDNDYRTRTANHRSCAGCGKPFAFERREGDPLADGAFAAAIDAVSEDCRLYWLDAHLYYEVARRALRRRPLHRLLRRKTTVLAPDAFRSLLSRWIAVYGQPAGRIVPGSYASDVRAEERAEDATAHGFDRLLVCGSDAVVDFLLANGFHGDHHCAVLSVTGYPFWAYDLLFPAFRELPPKAILVVHDADVPGCRLAREVKTGSAWFRGSDVEVVDVGLRPADAARFRGLLLGGSPLDALNEPVTVDEARWLARYSIGVEAARPRALLTVLAAALNGDPAELGRVVNDDGTSTLGSLWLVGGDGDAGDDVG